MSALAKSAHLADKPDGIEETGLKGGIDPCGELGNAERRLRHAGGLALGGAGLGHFRGIEG